MFKEGWYRYKHCAYRFAFSVTITKLETTLVVHGVSDSRIDGIGTPVGPVRIIR